MQKKKILLCVTGSIAAYKAVELVRLLIKKHAEVKVLMTAAAKQFVTPLTFEAISQNKVYSDVFAADEHSIEHIDLARWPDLILIAPASANTIAKLSSGIADDLLGNIVLATTRPIFIAPAMNKYMWKNTLVQEHIRRLLSRDFSLLEPISGEQACGDVGQGCFMPPEEIVSQVFTAKASLGLKVMITAGATVEPIDPVRFISNHSSGKMGYALAESFIKLGCQVVLVSGPTQLSVPGGVHYITVKTAEQMHDQVHQNLSKIDIFIAAAAVADYRPEKLAAEKIKKKNNSASVTLTLVKNPDILKSVSLKKDRPFCVGFAAETHNAHEYALEKLHNKKLDMLVLNQVDAASGFPFYSDENKACVYNKAGNLLLALSLMAKTQIADHLAKAIIADFNASKQGQSNNNNQEDKLESKFECSQNQSTAI